MDLPVSDLSRSQTQERNRDWPAEIAIVATYIQDYVMRDGKVGQRARKRKVVISKDQFYGSGLYGAPVNGEWFMAQVEQLRKETL